MNRWLHSNLTGLAVACLSACAAPAFVPPPHSPVAEPAAADVAAVLILVGDAGNATKEQSPLVHRLRGDVERWSAALPGREDAVAVAFLGDNVYPVGVRDRDDRAFPTDSARLQAQVWTVSGPAARAAGTPGIFLAGNHDWGNARGEAGTRRLENQERLLDELSSAGARVSLVPRAGEPGPVVVDLADAARLIVLDTNWWLQAESPTRREAVLADLGRALSDAGNRPVLVAAHHPFLSAGPHAGLGPVDAFFLLRKAGAVVQDLNSPPFRALLQGLGRTFEEAGRPLVYVAGHDHSLQVHRGPGPDAPEWALVSGAGSKLSGVGDEESLVWAGSRPGYMTLVVRRDGGVVLQVTAAPPEALRCDDEDAVARHACIEAGVSAFTTVYSAELRPGR